jgi:hypothetical protein
MEHVSIEAPLGDHGGDFERKAFFYWRLQEICKIWLCKRTSLSIGAPLGTQRGTLRDR